LGIELASATRPRPTPKQSRSPERSGTGGLHRIRRIALVAALVALVPAAFSYVHTMTGPSNSSLSIRSVEWLREHGAAGLVARVESVYYSLTAPATGGPTLRALPAVGYGTGSHRALAEGAAGSLTQAEYRPPRVPALLHPALPGEGVWHATRPSLEANPPVLLTTLRDQPEYPRVIAGLAWIDTSRTRLAPWKTGRDCSRRSTAVSSSSTTTVDSSCMGTPTRPCTTDRERSSDTPTAA
jgi:hypothetical protein